MFEEPIRNLYFDILRGDPNEDSQILFSHRDAILKDIEPLRKYGELEAIQWRPFRKETGWQRDVLYDLWHLYGISRIHEILTLPFQSGPFYDPYWHRYWIGPNISLEERHEFWSSLGMTLIDSSIFHPFYHEIVEVEQSDDPEEKISLVQEIWPGYMLGHMMFCRAGVKVRGGTNYIIKSIAENSTMFWAFWRKNRPFQDLSHGWGHNSQWNTRFRRDYRDKQVFYYNVDTLVSIDQEDDEPEELQLEEKLELLLNRCFIRTNKEDKELWPYEAGYVIQE